ncbi:MAG TPA: hypothetical protein VHF01_10565 [Candidatus Acidoferrum sp.]|nr:hypothetical protein [Candidatus Acidoferrum sp.]
MKALDNASAGWWTWPAYFLFFLMLAFPMMHTVFYVKVFLFALLLTFVVTQALTRLHLHPKVVMCTLALAAVSLFFGLRGLLLGAPGARTCIQVYAMWPLVYLVLLSGINTVRIFRGLQQTLVFSAAFIALFLGFYFLSQLNIVPQIPYIESIFSTEELDSSLFLSSGFFDGHVELSFPGLSSYPFLVPFLIAAVVCRPSQGGTRWTSRVWLSIALSLSLMSVLLSGRRALQLVTMLAPFLTLALGIFLPKKERRLLTRSLGRVAIALVLLVVLSVPLLSSVYAITFEGLADRFSAGFDFSASNQSDNSTGRVEQYLALKSGWMEAPLVGRGLGASAHASIRSTSMPWSYELSYLALLFQTGLLGFAAYTAGIAWIYWSGIKIIKCGGVGSQFMIPVLVGMSGLLIANGTNPYLARFDGIWVIFLPLAFINYWLLIHDHAQNPSSGRARQLTEQL